MLLIILHVASFVCLSMVAYQDFSERQIHWLLIPMCFALFISISTAQIGFSSSLKFLLWNLLFFSFQLLLLIVYFFMKHKRFVNLLDNYLGIGDILFILTLCSTLSPVNFLLFYFAVLVLTLFVHLVSLKAISNLKAEIPLAGVFAVSFMSLLFIHCVKQDFNLYNNDYFLSLVSKWS